MHFTKAKGILMPNNRMNLYKGCTHGCIYCDSRSKCYSMEHDFEDIEIKENAIELLENTLRRKRLKCMLGLGSMSDPYMPIENKIENTRKSLELAYKYGFGFSLITKSNRILRDIDLLKKINENTKCVVQITLTTYDDKLCRKIEPNVCSTKERFIVLKKLKEAGIPTIVWLCPILPFINDTEENINGILDYCIKAEVKGVLCFGMGLTLREGSREYFYKQLDILFPGIKEKYIRIYRNSFSINSLNNNRLMKLFHEKCEKNGIMHNNKNIFNYINSFEEKNKFSQLKLF